MLFALVPIQSLNLYGNSASYFCDPYKNDITQVAIGTHGLISPFSLIFASMWEIFFSSSFPVQKSYAFYFQVVHPAWCKVQAQRN